MKTKIIFIAIVIALASGAVSAQSVTMLNPKKVTYKRPKPLMDFKKTFTITYPRVKAATPALSKKIEAILSYEKIFDFTLKEEMTTIQWLENADYAVNYNANKMLAIELTLEGSGAYPSSTTKYIVVNIANGTRVRPADIFVNTSGLLAKLSKMRDEEVAKKTAEIKADPETKDDDVSTLFADSATYQKVTLDQFQPDEGGIVFHHDYGFPHVAQALQPDGQFFLNWEELKPFIKKGGLLARFVS
ncbi:MAG: hypothetical protein ABL952_03265 [Pyrinomonadaceae bacterium]